MRSRFGSRSALLNEGLEKSARALMPMSATVAAGIKHDARINTVEADPTT
jgi:hypothetical protein